MSTRDQAVPPRFLKRIMSTGGVAVRPRPSNIITIAVIVAIIAATGIAISSNWSTDPFVNDPVCNAIYYEYNPQIVADGEGGVIIAWGDQRHPTHPLVAVDMVDKGYTAVKFDPAGPYTIRGGHMPSMHDISLSVAFCKAIRDAVGDRVDLLFGTHGQFSTGGAIRLGKALEAYSPLWYEEPIPPDNVNEMAKVAGAVSIPIATGERLTTKAEFAPVLRSGAATILQPALGRSGGIWETKKIAAMAEVYNAQMAPHLYAGPVEWAANIQLAASIPNILMAETIETPFHNDLIKGTIRVEHGFVVPPDTPGLGIEVDEDLARAHPYTDSGLHLEMQEAPCDYANGNAFAGGAPVKTE